MSSNTVEILFEREARPESLESLVAPIEELVRAIQDEGGDEFQLYGLSPARRPFAVLDAAENRVEAFVQCSDIEWNFGREAQDPTYQIVFTNERERYGRSLFLRIEWVLPADEATCPGLSGVLVLDGASLSDVDEVCIDRLVAGLALFLDVEVVSVSSDRP